MTVIQIPNETERLLLALAKALEPTQPVLAAKFRAIALS